MAQQSHGMYFAGAGKPLIKFRHCERSIYTFSVPQCCPLCQGDLGSARIEDAPISISDPFSNGHQEKCSFLLKPTRGTFLRYGGLSYDKPCMCFCCVSVIKPSLKDMCCAMQCSVCVVALGRLFCFICRPVCPSAWVVWGQGVVACLPRVRPWVLCTHLCSM